ncbi:MAG: hypothetical protein JOZ54_13445, partial [Acidobacteria bacterium]|nr:hypothetical protein [Acidobacteriota bacterium]
MKRALTFAVALALALSATGQERDRTKIQDKYKWDLSQIYPTDDAWRAAKEDFAKQLPRLTQYKGHLGDSSASLLAAATTFTDLNKTLSRLYVYAAMKSDQDTRVATYQAMKQEMDQ